jgi:hypothetical protein
MQRYSLLAGLLLCLLTAGCDGAGPEADPPEPRFAMTLSAPVSASVSGKATLGSGASFDEQNLLIYALPSFGKTLTAIQLVGRGPQAVDHNLSLLYVADAPITTGTYEVGVQGACVDASPVECTAAPYFAGSLLFATYSRQTMDSLYAYPLDSGMLTVERATGTLVEGAFTLTTPFEISASRADVAAFADSLDGFTSDRDAPRDFPTLPPRHVETLDPALTVEGRFTATPGPLSNSMHSINWLMGGFMDPTGTWWGDEERE